ncbi:hypothetical protein DVH24_042089 [Malus domestica]|uniref:Uncharacterized protein n=1 Tax=Malus domestica TaxID=3750 RepID=A0A498IV98_MALDO|nr:hypothetical protein DVH24_042089 [Malus domestica]
MGKTDNKNRSILFTDKYLLFYPCFGTIDLNLGSAFFVSITIPLPLWFKCAASVIYVASGLGCIRWDRWLSVGFGGKACCLQRGGVRGKEGGGGRDRGACDLQRGEKLKSNCSKVNGQGRSNGDVSL